MTLEDRYGNAKHNRKNKVLGFGFAGLMVAMGVVFLATGGLPTSEGEISFRDIGMRIEADTEVDITFEVVTAGEKDMVCALDALSPSYATVGLKLVEIPASSQNARVFEDTVITTHRATSVTVRHCWFKN